MHRKTRSSHREAKPCGINLSSTRPHGKLVLHWTLFSGEPAFSWLRSVCIRFSITGKLNGFSLKQIPNLRFSPSQTFPAVPTHDKGAKVPLLREAPEDLETHKSLGSPCLGVIFQPRMDSRRLSWRRLLQKS